MLLHADVYLSLNNTVIANNSNVKISGIGSNENSALLCHTDYLGMPNSGGNWSSPDGTRVDDTAVPGFVRNRDRKVVRLLRKYEDQSTPVEGVYTCQIKNSNGINEILNVRLYTEDEGRIS